MKHFDKFLHFIISALLMFVLTAWICPMPVAALFTIAIGTGKELFDRQHSGVWDWADFIADILGMIVGFIVCWQTVGVGNWGF